MPRQLLGDAREWIKLSPNICQSVYETDCVSYFVLGLLLLSGELCVIVHICVLVFLSVSLCVTLCMSLCVIHCV